MLEPRARRSELATPASSERMCEKAAALAVPTSSSSISRTPARRWPRSRRGRPRCRAHRAGLGPDRASGAGQRPRHAVVPRRHHRGRHRRARGARRPHRAEGPLGARRLVGRRPAHPARDQARAAASASDSRCSSRRPRGWPTPPRSPRPSDRLEAIIFGAGDLSASLHARVDGNFDPVGDYPGDFWHFARVQVADRRRGAGIDAIDAPYPAYQDPDGYRRAAIARQPARLRRQVGHPPRPDPDRQRGVRADRRRDRRRRGGDRGLPERPKPTASAPSAGTASSSTPPTCGWPRTCCTRPRWPRAGGPGPDRLRRRGSAGPGLVPWALAGCGASSRPPVSSGPRRPCGEPTGPRRSGP